MPATLHELFKGPTPPEMQRDKESSKPFKSGSIFEEVENVIEKRRFPRKALKRFVGAYGVSESLGLVSVDLYDLSSEGASFDCAVSPPPFNLGDCMNLRIYVSKKNFFNVNVKISNLRKIPSKNTTRFGVAFSCKDQSRVTLYHFARFLELLSHILESEQCDRKAA